MGKKPAKEEEPEPAFYEAFFSGIPYECTEQDIKQFLGGVDGIAGIKLPRYQDTGRCRGYAHVKFDKLEAYERALAKDGQEIGKRYIKIEAAKG